jgi:CRISPR type III-B/RAMP module RAMP protein Cmr1
MLTLTNVRTTDGVIKSIASFPNGIAILSELIGTAEDIARYDIILILGDRGPQIVDPFATVRDAFTGSVYQSRIRWIWSRTVEQIIIDEVIGRYIVEKANDLNREYDCHIKIFGTEAWKKIARLSVAVAGYLVSTDETYEKIIVKQEHVDYAVEFFKRIYDNATFKLKEYVEHQKRYSVIDADGVALLQDVFIKCPGLIYHLEQVDRTTKNTLQAATGLNNDQYNIQINRLVAGMFVTFSKYDIIPTERFRLGVAQINRNVRATRVGETA